jgi:hypothetical protein
MWNTFAMVSTDSTRRDNKAWTEMLLLAHDEPWHKTWIEWEPNFIPSTRDVFLHRF